MTPARRYAAFAVATLLLSGCGSDRADTPNDVATTVSSEQATAGVERWGIEVLERHPHDTDAFTQGLLFDPDGVMWESTGLEGVSQLRRIDPESGAIEVVAALPADEFGEGLALGPDGFVQLTWQDGIAHRWSTSGDDLGTFRYDGEGWGLTFDGTHFIQSDGTATLTFRDPATFEIVRRVEVTLEGRPVDQLNELEWVDGRVLANVWFSEDLLVVDPDDGTVRAVVDASGLWDAPERTRNMTLNGIAHRPGDDPDVVWLTGKLWPELFVVRLTKDVTP